LAETARPALDACLRTAPRPLPEVLPGVAARNLNLILVGHELEARLAGSMSIFVSVTRDLQDYQNFLMNVLTTIPGVAHIESSFALKPVIQRPVPASR